jgi:hypothetical protein
MRSCRPFCCGEPGSVRSSPIPSLIHFTARRVSPPEPEPAKGGPLSERRAKGKPCSRKAASTTGSTPSVVGATTRQASRKRLSASLKVMGSQRAPSPVLNQPLKSMHHRSLGAVTGAKGRLTGSGLWRRRRVETSPSRRNSSPMVEAAGHTISGLSRAKTALSFLGPQRGCARLNATK